MFINFLPPSAQTTITTQAIEEEGGGPVTTQAVGEEGGDNSFTTLALNEEGGQYIPPFYQPQPPVSNPSPPYNPGSNNIPSFVVQLLQQLLTLLMLVLGQGNSATDSSGSSNPADTTNPLSNGNPYA